jgi:hypothetical protein
MGPEEVTAELSKRRWTPRFDAAIEAAGTLGDAGEIAMMAAWSTTPGRVEVAAALGDRRRPGPADDLLRQAIRTGGPGTQDLRCASVLSLAKRLGADATDDLVDALGQRDGAVRQYAVIALAAVGDDRGWEQVLDWFSQYRPGANLEPPSQAALSYLMRHLPAQPAERRSDLVRQVRRKWPVLVEDGTATMLGTEWPTVAPDGPPVPELPMTADLGGVNWASHRLFTYSHVSWAAG